MKKIKTSIILNIVNAVFIIFALITMIAGISFMKGEKVLDLEGYNALQFFTVDSNIILLASSLLLAIFEILLITNKINHISKYIYLFKYISTVATSVTMFTVLFFLAPITDNGYIVLFLNANLFFHLLSPLIGIISYVFFEYTNEFNKKYIYLGVVPVFLYGIYYVINVLVHMENGSVSTVYDWYQFAQGGVAGIIISIIVMHLSTLLLSFLLYLFNNLTYKRSKSSQE